MTNNEFSQFINDLPIGVYKTSVKDGQFIHANEECARILGYDTITELLSKSTLDFYSASDERQKLLEKLKERGKIDRYEIQLVDAHGKKVWVSLTAKLSKDKNTIQGSITDINRMKMVEMQSCENLSEIYQATCKRVRELDRCRISA